MELAIKLASFIRPFPRVPLFGGVVGFGWFWGGLWAVVVAGWVDGTGSLFCFRRTGTGRARKKEKFRFSCKMSSP